MLGIQWYHFLTVDLEALPRRMSPSVTHHGLAITVGKHTAEQSVEKIARRWATCSVPSGPEGCDDEPGRVRREGRA
jgi:hypothetical protein